MRRIVLSLFLVFIFTFIFQNAFAQKQPLTYYLPDIEYNENIPTPEQILGYQIGENHISHDQLVYYMRALAQASERVTLKETGRTYEGRPLLLLTITSLENQANIDKIQAEHITLSNPNAPARQDFANMPAVIYAGYSIHGNESSGSNAAPLVAYYLAAGKGKEVDDLLENTVILFDPCYNPDGLHRFSTWANSNKGKNLVSDPQSRELNEPWPRGRTNHYWFDLNRDWLPVQHPESQARIKNFHDWKPNVLTDHHEMGADATFFFQPGVPDRTNPLTPQRNQDLTFKVSRYHAKALDAIGSLYYTQESFDDFYYGKGSTYPDINGAVGILFEQASSRGHAQDTEHGVITFPFTIRNQVTTSFSTFQAAKDLREDFLRYQHNFYKNAQKEAAKASNKAYVVSAGKDKARLFRFAEMLERHQIDLYHTKQDISQKGQKFSKENSLIIPLEQTQNRLIRAMFETSTSFKDSLFYDVSAWTLPLAFDLNYAALSGSFSLGDKLDKKDLRNIKLPAYSEYAYLLDREAYYFPKALNLLQRGGLRTEVATNKFKGSDDRDYARGTILISVQNQDKTPAEIHNLVVEAARVSGAEITAINSGESKSGSYLGSPAFSALKAVDVAVITGTGTNSYDAGEVWHLLDYRMDIATTLLETRAVSYSDLSKYSVIVMVDGSYRTIDERGSDKLKTWVQNGGTLITMKRAATWAKSKGIANFDVVKNKKEDNRSRKEKLRPYEMRQRDAGAEVIGGAIFETKADLTHPLAFGLADDMMPVFRRGTLFFEPTKNAYATPFIYTDQPLLGGYISKANLENIRNSAAVIVSGTGSGKVICFADNPNFRAFWYGPNRVFLNAVFFGGIISGRGIER